MTGKELAIAAKVTPSWVRSVETGRTAQPAPDKLARVAKAVGLDIRELLALTDQLGAAETVPEPTAGGSDIAALATAIEHQAAAINALATRLDAMGQDARGTQDALIDALAVIARLVPATRTDVVTRLLGAIEESHRREDSADPTRQGTGR